MESPLPTTPHIDETADALELETKWFNDFLKHRIAHHFEVPYKSDLKKINTLKIVPENGQLKTKVPIEIKPSKDPRAVLSPPDLSCHDSPYAKLIKKYQLSPDERLIVLLALMPRIQPQALDIFWGTNPGTNRPYTEFGGFSESSVGCFIPTIETAIFLLAGKKYAARLRAAEWFNPENAHPVQKVIEILEGSRLQPDSGSILRIKKSAYSLLMEGKPYYPRFSSEFPAEKLTTKLSWNHLILPDRTRYEVENILNWLQHNQRIDENWEFHKHLRDGYRALFYGPSGTGKTLTATLLGEKMGLEVFRIDLSRVVSKYIGETEKNMANLFDQAEDKGWMLFFDEADALFGKRVNASSANDQHSNQQIAYLLQRIENYRGVVILATNLRGNMDKAFARRFQAIIHFAAPDEETRLKLWQAALPKEVPLDEEVNLKEVAKKYPLTGSTIINVIHYSILTAFSRDQTTLTEDLLTDGIRKELAKQGK